MLKPDKTKRAAESKSFDELLSDLALRLLKANPRSIDNGIRQSVTDIGEHYRVDNVQIRKFSADRLATTLLHWWSSSSEIGLSADRPNDAIPWASSLILRGNIVRIGQLSDMPPEATTGRQMLEADGLNAALLVPVVVGEQVYGSLLFGSKQDRRWSDEIVCESQVLGEVLAHAYERAQVHNSLWTNEARLRAVLENQSEFIVRWLPDGTRTWVNDRYCQFFKQPRESLIGTSFGCRLVHEADREKVAHKIKSMTPDNPAQTADYEVLLPNGEIGWHNWNDKGIFDDSGTLIEIQSVGRDVTDTKRAQRETESALAEIERLKDQLQEENIYLREEIRTAQGFDKIIGDSPQLRQALVAVEKVAPTSVPVLILGETGTGKELIAQAIHDLSGRKNSALISVNCAALSRDLIESELFGHEKGAFTGAHSQRKGRFERANGGTLFLDEIGDLPGESQAKLLRVLQTGGFERVGGRETLHVDARLIAATNKNLKCAVDEGEFRADLYYRISSFPIELPPLRERPEDIPSLAEFFVQKHANRIGKDIQSISARTVRYLSNQKWPGNVRELEGTIQRALISTTGPVLDYSETQNPEPESAAFADAFSANASTNLRDAERQHILNVLKSTRWVISGKFGAASMMGVPPSTLRSMMKRLAIKRAA